MTEIESSNFVLICTVVNDLYAFGRRDISTQNSPGLHSILTSWDSSCVELQGTDILLA